MYRVIRKKKKLNHISKLAHAKVCGRPSFRYSFIGMSVGEKRKKLNHTLSGTILEVVLTRFESNIENINHE
jgi:hypothetical protein